MVLVNVTMAHYLSVSKNREALPAMMVAMGCVLAMWFYGQWRLNQPEQGERVRLAVVQGNIPQEEKWDEAYRDSILAAYERLTHEAARHQPQLIIWPETAVPGYLGMDAAVTARVRRLARSVKTPLLVGSPMVPPPVSPPEAALGPLGRVSPSAKETGGGMTNSAALLDPSGAIVSRYDKLRLVPFGEFVPLESVVPWLRSILPPIGDFVPGQDYTVFHLGSGERSEVRGEREKSHTSHLTPHTSKMPAFSVLICFEDVFPGLARQFVRRGARMLVTITNDAWFGNTAAAYQHAQASTFRAVELRIPMVRAANTGWSGCIDAKGRWIASVRDPAGQELFVRGTAVCDVEMEDDRALRLLHIDANGVRLVDEPPDDPLENLSHRSRRP
jgi:apolipoprotein N-acyltransferase